MALTDFTRSGFLGRPGFVADCCLIRIFRMILEGGEGEGVTGGVKREELSWSWGGSISMGS